MMMEYIDGPDLYTRFLEATDEQTPLQPIPIVTISGIIRQLLLILKELHARDIIHRDLKSFNVLISDEVSPSQFDVYLGKS